MPFSNDPENLIIINASENQEKGAKDPANWLPDKVSYRCEYVKRWSRGKAKYGLTVDSKEEKAINAVLAGCYQVTTKLSILAVVFCQVQHKKLILQHDGYYPISSVCVN